jgi:GT2 family glycosyltransferase
MTLTTPAPPPAGVSSLGGQVVTQRVDGLAVQHSAPAGQQVVAVLVAHDGVTWLPRVLAAVAKQTRAPDQMVAVDNGSQDGSDALLSQALGESRVVRAPRSTGFGDAVRRGVTRAGAGLADGRDAWVWLLHDDSAPEPRALEHLLDASARSSSVAVVGPKVVAWDDPDLLREVGLSVGRTGRRSDGLDGQERDQGQHDHRTDVLAVSSAGMLIRREVWDELGGFDPALALLRDDIDLCWRTHLAGHRVVLAPDAIIADAQATVRGLRSVDAIPRDVRRIDRQHGMHVALSRASWYGLPFLLGWLAVVSVGRALLLLVTEPTGRAVGELRALAVVLFLPWRWIGSRWRSRGRPAVPRSSLSPLMTPRFAVIRSAVEVLGGWAAGHDREDDRSGGRHSIDAPPTEACEPGPESEEAQSMPAAPPGWPRRFVRHPMTTVTVLLAAATGLAWRGLLGRLLTGTLVAGELSGGQASASELWHGTVDGVRGSGLGTESVGSAGGVLHAGWVWLLAPLAGGAASSVALVLALVAAPVLAGCSAYLAGRVATAARWPRAWAALVWGGSPLLGTAVAQGRVGPVVAAVGLPVMAALLARALWGNGTSPVGSGSGRPYTRSGPLTATAGAALAMGLIAPAVPAFAVVAVLVALVAAVLGRGSVRARGLLLVALPVALLGPWVVEAARRPGLLLAGPGAIDDARPAAAGGSVTFGGLELNLPGAWRALVPASEWAAWAAAGGLAAVAVVGFVALLRGGPRGRAALTLGLVTVLGLGMSVAALTVNLDPAASGPPAAAAPLTAWAGAGALVALLALTAAALFAADGLTGRLAQHGFGWRQLVLGPVAVVAVVAPLAATAGWAWPGSVGPVTHSRGHGLPAVAADAATGPYRTRTLVLEQDAGRLRYRLDGGEPRTVSRDLPNGRPSPADQVLQTAVLGLVGRSNGCGRSRSVS